MSDRSRWQRDIASVLCLPCISLDSIGRGLTNENLVYFTSKNKQHLAKVLIKLGNLESRRSVEVLGKDMRSVVLAGFALIVLLCTAQEPIRVDVKLVNVAFSARDGRGALVDNLTRDDFEVFEDAVPQKISFFARSADVPLTLGLIVDTSGSQNRFSRQHQHDLEVFLKEVL